jgi:hypothetical protein
MKKIFYALLMAMPLVFASCDDINDDEKLTLPQGQTSQQTAITDSSSFQRILLEDYTGWKCTNCPSAAEIASNLLTKYGDTLVVMAVHCSSFAKPSNTNKNVDFRTEYGEKWYTQFGLSALPAGIVNRKQNSGTYYVAYNSWESEIASQKTSQEHVMNIDLGVQYLSSTNQILVSTRNVFLKDVDFPTLINVVVVESGLVGVQFSSTGTIPEYTFNHVLRKNGYVDYSLSSLSVAQGSVIKKNYLLSADKDIKDIHNCHVIVFVTNAKTNEVIQVNEIAIK